MTSDSFTQQLILICKLFDSVLLNEYTNHVSCAHYCLHWGVICCMYTLLSALGCYMLHVHTTVCIGVLYVECTHYCLHWGVICCMYTLLSALGCYMLHVRTTVCIGVLYVECTHYCLHWGVICCMYTIYRLISLICDIYLMTITSGFYMEFITGQSFNSFIPFLINLL